MLFNSIYYLLINISEIYGNSLDGMIKQTFEKHWNILDRALL